MYVQIVLLFPGIGRAVSVAVPVRSGKPPRYEIVNRVVLNRSAAPPADIDTDLICRSKVPHELLAALDRLRRARREALAPVVVLEAKLNPWVAYGIMPLFALANAGVTLDAVELRASGTSLAALGVVVRPELKGSLYAQLGNLEYEAGRYEAAASQYRRAEPYLDDESPSDRILLRYGLSLQRCGRFRHAKVVLLDLLDRFGTGPAAAEARRALSHVGNHYSIQCGVYRQQGV